MSLTNPDLSTPCPTHPSLRHFSRRAPSHGLGHNTFIIIVVSASVVGLLLTIIIWRFLSRFFRPKSAPLPPKQSLVHQRELQLAAFTEYKDAIVPQIHESDEATLDSSYGVKLHPPSLHIFPSSHPHNGSSSSLLSSNDDLPSSSGLVTPPTRLSTSTSPSCRRGINRSGPPPPPRPMSAFSMNSRQSTRGAPHAPHSNVQIVLPAPLAPNLYAETASDGSLIPRALTRDGPYAVQDSWRRSLADSWIVVGQDSLPDPELMEAQNGHDNMKRPSRLIRRGSSPGPLPPRSRSNPTPSSRLRPPAGFDQPPGGTHPPMPRVPSDLGRSSGDGALSPSTSSQKGGSWTTPPSSTHSHKPR